MASNVTANQGYQLPDATNKLKDDVLRVIAALSAIDTDVTGLLLALASKSNTGHGHGMDAIAGLVAALGNKLEVGYHDALGNLTDVDVAGVANGMALLRQASKWIPVALQINNIAGLETALNGKATPADITAAINALVGAAPGALDAIYELAAAIGNDPNFAATMAMALGARVAYSAQSKTDAEKVQALTNIGAIGSIADQNAQGLSGVRKTILGKNTLQAYEHVVTLNPVGQAVQTIFGLSDYHSLKIESQLKGTVQTTLGVQVSYDNGASWSQSYVEFLTQIAASTPTTLGGSQTGGMLTMSLNVLGPYGSRGDMTLSGFGLADLMLFTGEAFLALETENYQRKVGGYDTASTARNAIRFVPLTGGALFTGKIVVMGMRK